jgi:hypothetical protein
MYLGGLDELCFKESTYRLNRISENIQKAPKSIPTSKAPYVQASVNTLVHPTLKNLP